jgi:tRNA nucleotidyltransferase (CCA-adding enzyme)
MSPSLRIPPHVEAVLGTLWQGVHGAYVVGGSVRDHLLERTVKDWDVATDALPERILALFPDGRYQNRFGTVTVSVDPPIQITTFRRDHVYRDHRRPDTVTFTTDLRADLARRDFTVNALAYGRAAGEREVGWVDPTGGFEDLAARRLRAVGDPAARFGEDALRMLRGVRLGAILGFAIEPATRAAMQAAADTAQHLSAERIGQELRLMLDAEPPSSAFRLLDELGLLEPTLPELAVQRGIPQNKSNGLDLWGHTLATLDAAAGIDPADTVLCLAALLHDIGKPATRTEEGFHGHEVAGAELADRMLVRMALARLEVDRVRDLVRWHMYSYEPNWTDAAVRRFIRRVGPALLPQLFALRRADSVGSGLPADAGRQEELERRVAGELERRVPLSLADLAVNGDDLQRDAGIAPGPALGEILERLLDSVISDPERNARDRLLADARNWWLAAPHRDEHGSGRVVPAGGRGR